MIEKQMGEKDEYESRTYKLLRSDFVFFSLRWLTVFLRLLTPPLLLFLLAGFQIQKPSVCGDC